MLHASYSTTREQAPSHQKVGRHWASFRSTFAGPSSTKERAKRRHVVDLRDFALTSWEKMRERATDLRQAWIVTMSPAPASRMVCSISRTIVHSSPGFWNRCAYKLKPTRSAPPIFLRRSRGNAFRNAMWGMLLKSQWLACFATRNSTAVDLNKNLVFDAAVYRLRFSAI